MYAIRNIKERTLQKEVTLYEENYCYYRRLHSDATSMCGCSSLLYQDNNPAIAEITNESGSAYIVLSNNGLGYVYSGKKRAFNNDAMMSLNEGEKFTAHFFCNSCGHDETCESTAPFSKLFECDCPEDGGKNHNAKEYIVLLVDVEQNDDE